jgi:hypothetical protein
VRSGGDQVPRRREAKRTKVPPLVFCTESQGERDEAIRVRLAAVWLLVGLRAGRRGRQSVKEQQGQQSRGKIRFQGRACGCEGGVVWIRLSLERSWHGLLGLRT